MIKNIETEHGNIVLSRTIINQIVTDAVSSYCGKARLGNTGPIFKRLGNEENNNIIIQWDDELVITIYLIIRFGTSISAVSNGIIDIIKTQLSSVFGNEKNVIKVVITGVESKQHIVKREIEVKK